MLHNRILKNAFFLFAVGLSSNFVQADWKTPPTKICNIYAYEDCFKQQVPGDRYPSYPFILRHSPRAQKRAILIHGLTDSPYLLKDVARTLYDLGYDIHAILLPGHGTNRADLKHVKLEEWKNAAKDAIKEADEDADTTSILLGGFSAGGAVATWATHQGYKKVSKLMLFAPAIRIKNKFSILSCPLKWVLPYVVKKKEIYPHAYRSMATNAVCQLQRLTKELSNENPIPVPAFFAFTLDDSVIDPMAVQWEALRAKNAGIKIAGVVLRSPDTKLKSSIKELKVTTLKDPVRHDLFPLGFNAFDENGKRYPSYILIDRGIRSFILSE